MEEKTKIQNCFDDDLYQKEIVLKREDGTELCRFTVRQLTVYEINRCKSEDVETTYTALIKAGLEKFSNGDGKEIPVGEVISRLSKSRLVNGEVVTGLFETIAQHILGANIVAEPEVKNSV